MCCESKILWIGSKNLWDHDKLHVSCLLIVKESPLLRQLGCSENPIPRLWGLNWNGGKSRLMLDQSPHQASLRTWTCRRSWSRNGGLSKSRHPATDLPKIGSLSANDSSSRYVRVYNKFSDAGVCLFTRPLTYRPRLPTSIARSAEYQLPPHHHTPASSP